MMTIKSMLLDALNNVYGDSKIFTYETLANGQHHHEFSSKEKTIELVSNGIHFERNNDKIVIDDKYGISLSSISNNTIYHTERAREDDGYVRLANQYNTNEHVYIKLDKEKLTISLALGDKYKTLKLVEHTEFVWRPRQNGTMEIGSIEYFEKSIFDPFWTRHFIDVARHVLHVQNIKFPKEVA